MPMNLQNRRSASKILVLVMGERQLTESEKKAFERCLRPSGLPVEYQYRKEPHSPEEWLFTCLYDVKPDVALVLSPAHLLFIAQAMGRGFRHVLPTTFGDFIELSFSRGALPLSHPKKRMMVISTLGKEVETSAQRALENCFHKGSKTMFMYVGTDAVHNPQRWSKLGKLVEGHLINAIIMDEAEIPRALQSRTILDPSVLHVTIDASTGQVHQLAIGRTNISK